MKTLIFSIITFLMLFYQPLFSQNYFGTVTGVPLSTSNSVQNVYFGLEKINTQYLDVAATQPENNDKIIQWNLNNGNGTFGDFISFNSELFGASKSVMFIKLRPSSPVKDFVIGRDNGLQVHWNENGEILNYHQNFSGLGPNWTDFDHGVFDNTDNVEDVMVSDGSSTLYYFVNHNDGTFQNPNSITLPNSEPVYSFKIRQLNEKTEGYIQNNPYDRSDIVCVSKTAKPDEHNFICAYLNNNYNGFQPQPFTSFVVAGHLGISSLEVADLDGDGYNDVIVISNDGTCPTHFYAEAYKNVQGQFINQNTPMWSSTLTVCTLSCGQAPKVCIADLNKDGLNDLVFVMDRDDGLRAKVFINQYPNLLYTADPQETIDIIESFQPSIFQATTADIYGSETQDGGGIALLVSYLVTDELGGNSTLHLKVINASNFTTKPPPPIVQALLEYDQNEYKWHPHIHLNNRGERDFDHYEIWKWKLGDPQGLHQIPGNFTDTGWTDIDECVDITGQDRPWWNCYYYVKQVDKGNQVSIPSALALYTVGCIPTCDACGGDRPLMNINPPNSTPPDKFTLSNYPNPFNPSTKIHFALPKASKVRIMIYSSIGQLIKELTNGWYEAGTYSVEFNGSNLSSGIYFYRFEAGQIVQTKKMLLIK